VTLFDLSALEGAPPPEPPPETSELVDPDGAAVGAAPQPFLQPDTAETEDTEDTEEPDAEAEAAPRVEVRVSARRRKTSEARWEGDRIVVSLPAHLDLESRQSTIDWLVERLMTKHRLPAGLSNDDLLVRAIALSDRYLVGARPSSVRWVTNQTARWGSCSYYSGDIRVSHRLRAVPEWVLDSVLVHEVAHLTYPDHSPDFHRLAAGYPRHDEAAVFLAGYGLGLSRPTTP
jgi:metallopeptidase YgjP-like protein